MTMADDGGAFHDKASRQGDMGEGLKLEILREADGDVIVSIMGVHEKFSADRAIQFCVPSSGGGTSPKTWRALLDLQAAMVDDNAGRPQPVPPLPSKSVHVMLGQLDSDKPNGNGLYVPREAMQRAFLMFGERLHQRGGMPVELGIPKPDLFEKPADYVERMVTEVVETNVCGKLDDIRICGTQVLAVFTPGGPKGDLIKDMVYQKDYEFGLRCYTKHDADGKPTFEGPMTWSVIAPQR